MTPDTAPFSLACIFAFWIWAWRLKLKPASPRTALCNRLPCSRPPWTPGWLSAFWPRLMLRIRPTGQHRHARKRIEAPEAGGSSPSRKPRAKPYWTPDAVVLVAARRPVKARTYRKVATSFNLRYRHTTVSVEKDYVGKIIKTHAVAIDALHRQWRNRQPHPTPVDHTWAMDITRMGEDGALVLGILDHGSRTLLHAAPLRRKTACAIARRVIDVIEIHGPPRYLRTDNEGMFVSGAMRFVHAWFGMAHQRTLPNHPWQNGRIERFFGTLKREIHDIACASLPLSLRLAIFQRYYNAHRPHQALKSRTPQQVRSASEQRQRRDDSG